MERAHVGELVCERMGQAADAGKASLKILHIEQSEVVVRYREMLGLNDRRESSRPGVEQFAAELPVGEWNPPEHPDSIRLHLSADVASNNTGSKIGTLAFASFLPLFLAANGDKVVIVLAVCVFIAVLGLGVIWIYRKCSHCAGQGKISAAQKRAKLHQRSNHRAMEDELSGEGGGLLGRLLEALFRRKK